jgi:hypothetical protein
MKQSRKQLLEQFSHMAEDGAFGDEIKASQAEYASLPKGIAIFLKVIHDYRQKTIENQEFAEIREMFLKLIIVAYREAKRVDSDIALSIINSFIDDYPGVQESCLLPKWCSLSNACLAFREVAKSENKLLVWQQACKQFQAYNEFLNGLLPYLIILWRTANSKSVNTSVFSVAYSNKINQFKDLTGGDDGAFYLIFRLAQPKLRNAIAHETIWLDSNANKVRYVDGKPPVEHEIDLVNFMALCSIGSHLVQTYLAALAVIVVMENGTQEAQSLLPQDLVDLFSFVPTSAV